MDGDSTSEDPAEERDWRYEPDTTLGTADTVGEQGLADPRLGPAFGSAL